MKHDEWQRRVVGHLAYCKRLRLGYDEAWSLTIHAYPPPGGVGQVTTLFDERGERHEDLVTFEHRVCRDAYENRGEVPGSPMEPPIRNFRPDMLRDTDYSSPARRSLGSGRGRVRTAA